ncbi:MAG: NADH-ubiquinone oxidoreductase chain L [uncultured Chthoniobacterales bacterium]|uniref:NADH-ubiquinone oxidoreductase chain L n=1 Tax=uncultured Chthoniobacterales bacterium TaxID=1836801 RepID=A0A6J4H3T5_9BACT|nr:MAG: NADH-ubiquinone oxidoreductase chain L [uncultured Chthoniobacterales bacterium]
MASALPWFVLILPLVSAATILLATRRLGGTSAIVSVGAAVIGFLASCMIFASPETKAPEFAWIDIKPFLYVPLGVVLDQLSKTMLLVVTGVGALIHIYSLGYMRDDAGKSRYFASLSFFMFSMLGIVLANNFVMMFIFWELVGVSSYLLIGHWFERDSAADAANKAFLTNRIGDFGFMLGILMVWASTGSVVFSEIAAGMGKITTHPGFLTAAALLIFTGAMGKSAQFPLHVWLPDAMEGPTPVSALIHAATMVAAGVYMLVRVSFLIQVSPTALTVIAWIGGITALMAALIATQQNDIKRILAYSTLSQLGYMVMAVGLASGEAAMFHLFTHAFFKALLFLGAGSIIVMLHHEQNIWKMGALSGKMRITFLTFLIGTLALIGFPFTSGFFSKDAILAVAYAKSAPLFWIALFTAFLTAFYMLRLVLVVFFGKSRSEHAAHGKESPLVMTAPLLLLAIPALIAGFGFFAHNFLPVPHADDPHHVVPIFATGAMAVGVIAAFLLYRNREHDPVSVAIFRNRFYFDELYVWLIRSTQELLASISAFIDRWIIDVGGVRGASGATWGVGSLLRLVQVGNLQAYSFIFGLGIVGLIYFTVFR